jgi:hypothetical protein
MRRRTQRLATPDKATRHPFSAGRPASWYDRFIGSLNANVDAERVRTYFLTNPKCDFFKVGTFAISYAQDSKGFARSRKAHLKHVAADLRQEERWLSGEIDAFIIPRVWKPAEGEPLTIEGFFRSAYYRALRENEIKKQQLDRVRRSLNNIPRVANTKRSGLQKDLRWLFIIREYLQWKSGGVILNGKDLAVIVNAGYEALAARGATLLFCVAEFISEIAMTPRPAES